MHPTQPAPTLPDDRTHAVGPPVVEGLDAALLPERYLLQEEVARGGMGVIVRVQDTVLGRSLALKVLQARFRDRPDLVQRFLDEARIAGQLQHPGVAPVHDLGQLADGRPFFTMKLVRGQTLAELLNRRGGGEAEHLPLLQVFAQVCQAVAYAHSRGVIHRDLKPANIMVGSFGEVQVMDWGLAKVLTPLRASGPPDRSSSDESQASVIETRREGDPALATQSGSILGTFAYMPPEQARGEVDDLDARCDVFALGAMLCELLTGQPPYPRDREEARAQAQRADLAPAWQRLDGCGHDRELVDLARSCLAASRAARPLHAGVVADAIRSYQAGVQERLRRVEMEGAAARARAVEERKRRRVLLAFALTLFVLGVATAGSLLYGQHLASERQRERLHNEQQSHIAVQAALQRAHDYLDQGRWSEARTLVEQARERLGEGSREELHQEVATTLTRLDQIDRLDQIAQQRVTLIEGQLDHRRVDHAYEAFFREYGLGQVGDDVEVVARRIEPLGIQPHLVEALDNWAFATNEVKRRTWVFALTRRIDPHPVRQRFRSVTLWQDAKALAAEGKAVQSKDFTRALLVALAAALPMEQGTHLVQEAVQLRPADFWLNLALGARLSERKRWDEAIAYQRVAVALRPKSAAAHVNLGVTLSRKGALDEAIRSFEKANEFEPRNGLAMLNLSVAWKAKGNLQQAHLWLERARACSPRDPRNAYHLGALRKAEGKRAEAQDAFRTALELAPDFLDAHLALARLLEEAGKRSEALAQYRRAIAQHPKDPTPLYNLGNLLSKGKQHQEAIACFRKAIALAPHHAEAHNNLGLSLAALGKTDQAVACYRKALHIDPRLAQAHNNLGNFHKFRGEYDQAIACYHRAIECAPRDPKAYSNLGVTMALREQWPEALTWYRKAIAVDASNAPAHAGAGFTLLELGHYAEAEASMQRALALLPRDDPMRQTVSDTLARCQRMHRLDGQLLRFLKGEITPATNRERLDLAEMCCRHRQRPLAAVRFYTEAFTSDPSLVRNPLGESLRFQAACAAARAGLGQGRDAVALDDGKRRRLRQQALDWLRGDLAALGERAEKGKRTALLRQTLHLWQTESAFAMLRGDLLDEYPEAERAAWTKLWSDVQTLSEKLRAFP